MKRRGMTYATLARELGVHKSTVGNWIAGRKHPGAETIRQIASILGVTLPEPCHDIDINLQECELIAAFRRMSSDERKALLAQILDRQDPFSNHKGG